MIASRKSLFVAARAIVVAVLPRVREDVALRTGVVAVRAAVWRDCVAARDTVAPRAAVFVVARCCTVVVWLFRWVTVVRAEVVLVAAAVRLESDTVPVRAPIVRPVLVFVLVDVVVLRPDVAVGRADVSDTEFL